MIRISKQTSHELEWRTRKKGATRLRATVQKYCTLIKLGERESTAEHWLDASELLPLKRLIDKALRLSKELQREQ